MESSSSAPFKRARALGSGNQVPSCLVDGCTADLSKCRDYHRRHKVCEVHSKTPKVTIRGQEQRFCQQCSRFHSLVEFDEGKRSCRKRLDGHNRRRRKPQPDSLSVNSRSFLSNHPGTRYLPFSSPSPQIFPTTAIASSWVEAVKVETDVNSELNFSSRDSLFPGCSSHSYKGEKQFSFLQRASPSLPGVSVCQQLLDANPSSSNGGSSRKMYSNGLNQAIDSSRVHSLLSSQPAETREIGLSPMVQSGPTSSLFPNFHYNGLVMEGEQVGTILAAHGSSNANLLGHEMFRTEHPGSSPSGTHQTLSFSWE